MLSKGILYMFYATFFFACMNVCIKYLPHIPAIEIVFFRAVTSLGITYWLIVRKGVSPWGNRKGLLWARGLIGTAALFLIFITLQKIPLGAAVILQFLAPIFTTFIGALWLKERVKWYQWVFLVVSFYGVLLIQQVDVRIDAVYTTLGLLASLSIGIAYNLVRELNKTEDPLVIIFYLPLAGLPLALIYCFFHWVTPVTAWDWLLLLLVGAFTQLGQYFLTKSYQAEEVAKVSYISYLGIVYALAFGYFLFDETYNWESFSGMLLVLTGVALSVFFAQKKST